LSQLGLRLFKHAPEDFAPVLALHLLAALVATLFPQEPLQQASTVKLDVLLTRQEIIFHQELLNPHVQHLDTVQKEHQHL
jgi:hypothetical protein